MARLCSLRSRSPSVSSGVGLSAISNRTLWPQNEKPLPGTQTSRGLDSHGTQGAIGAHANRKVDYTPCAGCWLQEFSENLPDWGMDSNRPLFSILGLSSAQFAFHFLIAEARETGPRYLAERSLDGDIGEI